MQGEAEHWNEPYFSNTVSEARRLQRRRALHAKIKLLLGLVVVSYSQQSPLANRPAWSPP